MLANMDSSTQKLPLSHVILGVGTAIAGAGPVHQGLVLMAVAASGTQVILELVEAVPIAAELGEAQRVRVVLNIFMGLGPVGSWLLAQGEALLLNHFGVTDMFIVVVAFLNLGRKD